MYDAQVVYIVQERRYTWGEVDVDETGIIISNKSELASLVPKSPLMEVHTNYRNTIAY